MLGGTSALCMARSGLSSQERRLGWQDEVGSSWRNTLNVSEVCQPWEEEGGQRPELDLLMAGGWRWG